MEKFQSHFVLHHRDSELIKSLNFDDLQIDLELAPEPTKTYWKSKDGRSELHSSESHPNSPERHPIPSDQLIIIAANEGIAEDALSTIKGGILLAYPDLNNQHGARELINVEKYDPEIYTDKAFHGYFKRFDHVGYGCYVLKEAYGNVDLQYAIEKYKLSLEINSMTPHSANPKYGQMFDHYKTDKSYHTSGAFAIIAAFSAVEELGLEVRSSSEKHRFLDNENGVWNPEVLNDVNKRLGKIGISEEDTFDWIFRGEKTEIEKDLKPYFGYDSQWTEVNEDVRDKTLTFPEAIHNLSYLRNFIASHKFKELTQYISPYDIFNAQSLARNLILRSLGMWQVDIYKLETD